MSGVVVRIHEYVLANGGVPESVQQVVELDRDIGHRFEYRGYFEVVVVRTWLGLAGNAPPKLPDQERLRLANLLRRAGEISDEELERLGMISRPIVDMLATVQQNRRANQGIQVSEGHFSS